MNSFNNHAFKKAITLIILLFAYTSNFAQTADQVRYQELIKLSPSPITKLKDAQELAELTSKLYTPKDLEYFIGYQFASLNTWDINPRLAIKYSEIAIEAFRKNWQTWEYPHLISDNGITQVFNSLINAYGKLGLANTTGIQFLEANKEYMIVFSNNTRCTFYSLLGDLYMTNMQFDKASSNYALIREILDSGEPMIVSNRKDHKLKKNMDATMEPIYRDACEWMYSLAMGNYYFSQQQYENAIPFLKKTDDFLKKTDDFLKKSDESIKKSEARIKKIDDRKKNASERGIVLPDEDQIMYEEFCQHNEFRKEVVANNTSLILSLFKTDKKEEALTYAKNLADKAYYYHLNNDLEKSEQCYKEMFAKADTFNNSVNYKWVASTYNKSLKPGYLSLQCTRKNYDYAVDDYKTEISNEDKLLQQDFAYLSENEKKEFFKLYAFKLGAYYSVLIAKAEQIPAALLDILNKSLQTKGLLMEATNEQEKRFKNVTDQELLNDISKIKLFREKIAAYSQIRNDSEDPTLEDSILRYTLDINSLQKKINTKLGVPATLIKDVNWKNIQAKLKLNETYVEIIKIMRDKYDFENPIPQYWAFVVKNIGEPESILLGEGNEFEGGLQSYQKLMWSVQEDTISYNRYWKKIALATKDKTKLFLSSDGIYQLMNPYTFKNTSTNKYVLDETDLVRIATGRDLLNQSLNKGMINTSVFIGNPNFNMSRKAINVKISERPVTAQMVSTKRSGFSMLPGTEIEVNAIATFAKTKGITVTTLQGDKASEVNVKAIVNPEVLHLATHGAYEANTTGDSYLKSKLLLAGAGDEETFTLEDYAIYEDGYLTAYEVTQMELKNTKLVVLSACETGLGDVQSGEGVWGLQRAFQIAGAGNVLSSLWAISDDATAVFMESFYKAYYSKIPIKSSYQTAMKETRKTYPHPFYWGAFVLTGVE